MKSILLRTILTIVTSIAMYGQGTVYFDNLGVNAPFFDFDYTGPGTKPSSGAGLYIGDSLVPGSITSFLGNTDPAAQCVNPIVVTIPGVVPGDPVTLRIGIWTGGNDYYSATLTRGFTKAFTVITGGAGDPPSPPADLLGLSSYIIPIIPEPSTISLVIISAGVLLFGRGRH